jgi:lipopolysaccharide/colanic/teichoic acid biosynthesis glycosyltransferase
MATGDCPDLTLLNERYPTPLLPLLDRPFVQHVVEFLIGLGATEFDFVLSRMPEKIEQLLGDGTRWGSAFRYHLAREAARPYPLLRTILAGAKGEPVMFVHANRLPLVQLPKGPSPGAVFCWREPSPPPGGDPLTWTGWAWLPAPVVADLPDGMDEQALGRRLVGAAQGQEGVVEVARPLGVTSYHELLDSHRRVLGGEFPGLMLSGREVDKGIWLSRNVSLHPTARLAPPVYIGENTRIAGGVQLGPNVVVGRDTILDSHSIVADSVIFPGSYVGEALQLDHAIVDKNCLVNAQVGAAVSVTDDFILGSMSEKTLSPWIGNILARTMALVLLALTSPFLLATAVCLKVGRGRAFHKREVVRLPASDNEGEWRTFHLWTFALDATVMEPAHPRKWSIFRDLFLSFLPALINIVRGDMRFVGVKPRPPEEIRALPSDWKALYLRTKAGVVTEAFVQYGDNPTEDELYSSEAFYSVSAGIRHDFRVLLTYLARIFTTPPQGACIQEPQEAQDNGSEEK